MLRAAAVQLEAVLADVDANLAACERLADQAGRDGARVIALPEFFTSGIGFSKGLIDAILPFESPATELLTALAARHGALVGGSFLCRDPDGHVRNAYVLAGPDGIVGRHDKDLPTMWENAFYVEGHDSGILPAQASTTTPELTVGVALCWEFMRTQTVHRLRGSVDLVMGGSGWWSIPSWPPGALFGRLERRNAATARHAAASFATYVGAPVVHAAHAGALACRIPGTPLPYRGHFEGSTLITDAGGTVLGARDQADGEGIVIADITPGRVEPTALPPAKFWLHRRGLIPAGAWAYQRQHGPWWYRRHVAE